MIIEYAVALVLNNIDKNLDLKKFNKNYVKENKRILEEIETSIFEIKNGVFKDSFKVAYGWACGCAGKAPCSV